MAYIVSGRYYKNGKVHGFSMRVRLVEVRPVFPSANARILVSRNKREGWYVGCFASGRAAKSAPQHVRSFHRSRTLRKPPRSKVNFADLGIKLSTPQEALNGQG